VSNNSALREQVTQSHSSPKRGVVGLVDDLLTLSTKWDLLLAWEAGNCQVGFPNGGLTDNIEVPMPKSVFRAALARIAVLCNERNPNSVSPWGGRGQVAIDSDPAKSIDVVFVNTPESQSLGLTVVGSEANSRGMQEMPLAADIDEK
jgi:hypothetical protein